MPNFKSANYNTLGNQENDPSAPAYPAVKVLAQSAVASSVTGTVAETVLATIPIPAGLVGLNGAIRVRARYTCTGSTNTKSFKTKFGGTTFIAPGTATAAVISFTTICTISNRGSLSAQIGDADGGGTSGGTVNLTGTIDTSKDQNVTICGQLANTGETLTLEGYQVELLPG